MTGRLSEPAGSRLTLRRNDPLTSAAVLGGSLVVLLGAFVVESAVLGMLAVFAATGAILLLLPRKYTWRGAVTLWRATLMVEATIMGSAISVLFLVDPVHVQLGLYAGLLTAIGILVVLTHGRGVSLH